MQRAPRPPVRRGGAPDLHCLRHIDPDLLLVPRLAVLGHRAPVLDPRGDARARRRRTLLFEDGRAAPRPSAVVDRSLRELPASRAPAPSSWESYARALKAWTDFLAEHWAGPFDSRERLKAGLSRYAEHRAAGLAEARPVRGDDVGQHTSILAMFAPGRPAVAPLPGAHRTALHQRSCAGRLDELTRFFHWLGKRVQACSRLTPRSARHTWPTAATFATNTARWSAGTAQAPGARPPRSPSTWSATPNCSASTVFPQICGPGAAPPPRRSPRSPVAGPRTGPSRSRTRSRSRCSPPPSTWFPPWARTPSHWPGRCSRPASTSSSNRPQRWRPGPSAVTGTC